MTYVRTWGEGEHVAVLIHGIQNDSTTWWRVGPELAARGYRVLAPDLLGHGQSPRGEYTVATMVDALLAAVPARPALAIGHSLGGLLLGHAVDRLAPERAVYEDPAWLAISHELAEGLRAEKDWTEADVAAAAPRWSAETLRYKMSALAAWDPDTAAAVDELPEFEAPPATRPSLVLLADPTVMVPESRLEPLRRKGYTVQPVAGAGHSVHHDEYDTFMSTVDEWTAG